MTSQPRNDDLRIEWDLHELGSRPPAPSAGPGESDVRIRAADGYPLAATLFQPERANGIMVQINSAYAVPRAYYAAYARYLTTQGFAVLTFDYRGIGHSRARSWRGDAPTMRHWGERDVAAVIDWLTTSFPHHRLVQVGHSAGGQLLGLAANNRKVEALLGISSQSGYWALFDWPYNALALAWFYAVVPGVALLSRLIPSLQRGGFDAPPGAALEWARWGRNPHYISDERGRPLREHFRKYAGRVRLYHITDDLEFAPRRAVEALAAFYSRARVEVVHRAPSDWNVKRVGHFDFFRESMPRAAWLETARWLATGIEPRLRVVNTPAAETAAPTEEEFA